MRAKAEEATGSRPQIIHSIGQTFTTKDAKHILSMIHTEEEEETLSELHLHEKRQKLKKHLDRVLKTSHSSQWPPMHLLKGKLLWGHEAKLKEKEALSVIDSKTFEIPFTTYCQSNVFRVTTK